MTSQRRPHWDDDLITAVCATGDDGEVDYWMTRAQVHRIIAAVEDWARWEHVPKGTLARLERAESAIARVRQVLDEEQRGYSPPLGLISRIRNALDGERDA